MIDEHTAALRLLRRRGIKPIDVTASDAELYSANSTRTARGNISMHLGNVQTAQDLDEAKARRRARLLARHST